MEQEKQLRILMRQIKDIQSLANKILSGDKSNEAIENFSRYSEELRSYIQTHVKEQQLVAYISDLPEVRYKRSQIRLWQYLILPAWWITLGKDMAAKGLCVNEIRGAMEKYSGLELLLNALAYELAEKRES